MRAVRITEENKEVLGKLFFGDPSAVGGAMTEVYYLIEDDTLDSNTKGAFIMSKTAFDMCYCFIQPKGEIEGTFCRLHLTMDELLRRFEMSKKES